MSKLDAKKTNLPIIKIIISVIAIIIIVGLFILNFIIPLKYLFSFITTKYKMEEDTCEVRFLDVGYGDATIIKFANGKSILIDTGDDSYTNNKKVIKELNKYGIKKIDYLFCTSAKKEHIGGLTEILSLKQVETLYIPEFKNIYINDTYKNAIISAKKYCNNIKEGAFGLGEVLDDFSFMFLSPSSRLVEGNALDAVDESPTSENINNASFVLWIKIFNTEFLFMSDAGYEVEESILTSFEIYDALSGYDFNGTKVSIKNCSVLKAANHGIYQSSIASFVDYVNPDYSVISVGENNYDCPSIYTISNLQNSSNVLLTNALSDIVFKVYKDSFVKV